MPRGGSCFPAGYPVNAHPGETPDPEETKDDGHNDSPVPGYFPRLLSAAAHVSHLASDGVLERFSLNRARFTLLGLLAGSPTETALGAGAGLAPDTFRTELHALQDLGFAAPGPSGIWTATDAGLKVMQDARVAEAEMTLDAEDSLELRTALRSLIASLREDPPGRTPGTHP